MLAVGPVNWTMLTSHGPWTGVETVDNDQMSYGQKTRGKTDFFASLSMKKIGCFHRNPEKNGAFKYSLIKRCVR